MTKDTRPIMVDRDADLRIEMRTYLDTLTITGDNIGDIRRSLFMPFNSSWNGWVRDDTAERERPAAPTAPQPPAGEAPDLSSWNMRLSGLEMEIKRLEQINALLSEQLKAERMRADTNMTLLNAWQKRAYEAEARELERAASVSGEAEPQRLDSRAHLGDGDGAARELAEPTYRALKAEAGHWMAETKRLRLEVAALTDENAALRDKHANLNSIIVDEMELRQAAERRADALRTERDKCLRAWELRDRSQEPNMLTQPASGTAETIQLARRREQ